MGRKHSIVIREQDDFIPICMPIPEQTFRRHINTYRALYWKGESERTCVDPRCTMAECTFTYEEGSFANSHGIRIYVDAYEVCSSGAANTSSRKFSSEQE